MLKFEMMLKIGNIECLLDVDFSSLGFEWSEGSQLEAHLLRVNFSCRYDVGKACAFGSYCISEQRGHWTARKTEK